MVTLSNLTADDIEIFRDKDILFISDFRGLAEDLSFRIPAYFKYENLFSQIHPAAYTTNELSIPAKGTSQIVVAPMSEDPRITILSRILVNYPSLSYKKIWQTVPHPVTDELCSSRGMTNHYSYTHYLRNNNKIRQKELHPVSPKWEIISRETYASVSLQYKNFYIKRELGSGGFMVIHNSEIEKNPMLLSHLDDETHRWYIEEEILGTPHSVQIYSNGQDHHIFGWSRQIITEKKYFSGADILPTTAIPETVLAFAEQSVSYLSPLLEDFSGFWGIDFLIDETGTLHFLEANIRTTALSFPTLLANSRIGEKIVYLEDVPYIELTTWDIILGSYNDTFDLLRHHSS